MSLLPYRHRPQNLKVRCENAVYTGENGRPTLGLENAFMGEIL